VDLIEKCLSSFQMCALVSAHYSISQSFDNLMVILSDLSGIPTTSTEETDVAFDQKAQLATVALFTLSRTQGNHLREGWRSVLSCLTKLYTMKLTPKLFTFDEVIQFPEEPSTKEVRQTTSLVNIAFNLGSWLIGRNSSEDESEEKNIPTESSKTIEESKLKELIQVSALMKKESLLFLVNSLISGSIGDENENTTIFCLDILSELLIKTDNVLTIWPIISNHYKGIITSQNIADNIVKKAVENLLFVSFSLLKHDSLGEETIELLQLLTKLKPHIENAMAYKISWGFRQIFINNLNFVATKSYFGLIFPIIRFSLKKPSTVAFGFDIIDSWIQPRSENNEIKTYVTKENFQLCLELLALFSKDEKCPENISTKCRDLIHKMVNLITI